MSLVMAGCSRNDFFCITLSFPLQHYRPCYAKKNKKKTKNKKKKILITLNAFEDEQFNCKAEVRCDLRVVPGL